MILLIKSKNLNRDKNNSLISQLVEKDEEIFSLRVNKNLKFLSISLISIFIFVSFLFYDFQIG